MAYQYILAYVILSFSCCVHHTAICKSVYSGIVTTIVLSDSLNVYTTPDFSQSDTLHYGVVLIGDTVRKKLYFRNASSVNALIPTDTRPYFFRTLSSNSTGNDDIDEWGVSAQEFPLTIPRSIGRDSVEVLYVANSVFLDRYKLGLREAIYNISIRNQVDTTLQLLKKNIFLSAIKVLRPIYLPDTIVAFDSVYVLANTPKVLPIVVRNISLDSSVQVTSEFATISGNSNEPFTFASIPSSFAKTSMNTVFCQYRPTVRGRDSAVIRLIHRNYRRGNIIDTTRAFVRGFGIEQEIAIVGAENSLVQYSTPRVIGDTIDIGDIDLDTTNTVRIYFSNKGNIDFIARQQQLRDIISGSTNGMLVVKHLSSRNEPLQSLSLDTLSIAITPSTIGEFAVKYTFKSDIENRNVYGVPQQVINRHVILRGRVVAPNIIAAQSTLEFGTVVYSPECVPIVSKTLRIRNTGTKKARITSIDIEPPSTVFTINRRQLEIDINQEDTIVVTYVPQSVGIHSANVLFKEISTRITPLSITLQGESLQRPNVILSTPEVTHYTPGKQIDIPVIVSKQRISLANRATFTLQTDSTMVALHSVILYGATRNSDEPIIVAANREESTITLQSGTQFLESDTLCLLRYSTYLGNNFETRIQLRSPLIGTSTCSNIFTTQLIDGSIVIDSTCGMWYRVGGIDLSKISLNKVFPNPLVLTDVSLEIESNSESSMMLKIVSMFGEVMLDNQPIALEKGTNVIQLDVSKLSNGTYYLVLQNTSTMQTSKFTVYRQ